MRGAGSADAEAPLPLFWRADPAGRWTWCCAGWTRYTGLSEAASVGDGWLEGVHPDDRTLALAPWADRDDAGHSRAPLRVRARRDGAYRALRPVAASSRDAAGALGGWVGTLDRAGGAPDASDGHLQHRLRNVLAVIRSVARRTARTSADVEHYAAHFEGRLDALARIQDVVTRSPGGRVDLEGLIGEELLAHRIDEAAVTVEGPAVSLAAAVAEPLGLALHELVVNAVKFGAFASPRGAVAVNWSVEASPEPALHLAWRETGIAVAGVAPRRRGFGTDLIERGLPYDLGGAARLEFRPGELVCAIALPCGRGVAPAEDF